MIHAKVFAVVAIFITLTACATGRRERVPFSEKAAAAADQTAIIQVGSLSRTFRWHIPKAQVQGQRLPVIVLLHGGGGSGANISKITQPEGGFNAFADQNGFIAVYPDALGGNWNDGRETIPHKNDDVGFVIAAIDYVAKVHPVDLNRVYIAGISNGGMMAQRIACEAPQRVSAIAVVASAMPRALANTCRNSSVGTPAVFFTGDADPLVPFYGGQVKAGIGGDMLSAADTVNFWVSKNAATFQGTRKIPDNDPRDGTTTTLDTYQSKGRTAVAFYRIAGGGHTWPGGTQYVPRMLVGTVAMDFSANQAIWDFFVSR
jgi:polyhydroxybutyrate depolymerase